MFTPLKKRLTILVIKSAIMITQGDTVLACGDKGALYPQQGGKD